MKYAFVRTRKHVTHMPLHACDESAGERKRGIEREEAMVGWERRRRRKRQREGVIRDRPAS